jgi:hypothetical protein
MKFLKVPTMVWYYLPFLALTGLCMDIALDSWVRNSRNARLARLALIALVALAAAQNIWRETRMRMTRVDLAAAAVRDRARPEDLVVVWPWYTACVFNRYYTGSAPWIALPDFADKRWIYYPVFRERMFQENAIRSELERIESTLKAGGRVWLVGGLQFLRPGEEPIKLPAGPVFSMRFLWNDLVYGFGWSQQCAQLLQAHSQLRLVDVAPNEPCRLEENQPLFVVQGWR